MNENIASIINYCSNDYPFLKECLLQAKKFSKKIIVPVADHLFNGEKEDLMAMERLFSEFDFATFVIYPFIPEKIPSRILKKVRRSALWHSVSRSVGCRFLEEEISHVLFLDVDEIVDGERFCKWLKEKKHLEYDAMRLAGYWYFRSTSLQADKWEDAALLVKRSKLTSKALLDSNEREAIFDLAKGSNKKMVLGLDSLPMIHHYSWVKTKEQMLKKVASWGHKNDKSWQELIEKEFERIDSDRDFVHGYKLIKMNPFAQIRIDKIELDKIEMDKVGEIGSKEDKIDHKRKENIIYLSKEDLLKILMKRSLKDYIYCQIENAKVFFKNF